MRVLSFDIGIKNMAYCVAEGSDWKSFKVIDWKLASLTGGRNVDLLLSLDKVLRNIPMDNFDSVVIEQQPFCRNSIQLSCQLLAYSIFMHYHRWRKPVSFQQPQLKFKAGNSSNFNQLTRTKPSSNYTQRKVYTVLFVQNLISNRTDSFTEDQVTLFKNARKQDDLADSLMIALYSLQNPPKSGRH